MNQSFSESTSIIIIKQCFASFKHYLIYLKTVLRPCDLANPSICRPGLHQFNDMPDAGCLNQRWPGFNWIVTCPLATVKFFFQIPHFVTWLIWGFSLLRHFLRTAVGHSIPQRPHLASGRPARTPEIRISHLFVAGMDLKERDPILHWQRNGSVDRSAKIRCAYFGIDPFLLPRPLLPWIWFPRWWNACCIIHLRSHLPPPPCLGGIYNFT